MDSDDYVVPNCAGKIVSLAEENDLDAVFVQYKLVDQDNNTAEVGEKSYSSFSIHYGEDAVYQWEGTKKTNGWAFRYIVRKEYLNQHDLRFIEGAIFEDIPFNYFLFKNIGRFGTIKEIFYLYRWQPKSITKTNGSRSKKYIESRILIASYYKSRYGIYDKKTNRELKERILYDVQGALNMAIAVGDTEYTKEIISRLKGLNLYPYAIPVHNLIPHTSLRKSLIDLIGVLYPVQIVPILLTKISNLISNK